MATALRVLIVDGPAAFSGDRPASTYPTGGHSL
jgi:hypothetical protein